ncbi:hypothetical protein [Cupriavidus sp.]|uniref:hypothetical protein n=1 Tax=Cupriavidus sp. TaxID=1873897 RepID=UPI003D0DE75B
MAPSGGRQPPARSGRGRIRRRAIHARGAQRFVVVPERRMDQVVAIAFDDRRRQDGGRVMRRMDGMR